MTNETTRLTNSTRGQVSLMAEIKTDSFDYLVFVFSYHREIRIFDIDDLSLVRTLEYKDRIRQIAALPDGRMFFLSANNEIMILNLNDWSMMAYPDALQENCSGLSHYRDNKIVMVTGIRSPRREVPTRGRDEEYKARDAYRVSIFDCDTMTSESVFTYGDGYIRELFALQDGKILLEINTTTVILVDPETHTGRRFDLHQRCVGALLGGRLALVSDSYTGIYDESMKLHKKIRSGYYPSVSPEGELIILSYAGDNARVYQ